MSYHHIFIFVIVSFLAVVQEASSQILWSPIGPSGGGYLTDITVTNAAQGVIYASGTVSGIYRSTNSGMNWEMANNGLMNYYVHDIAYDPQDPTVLYAATVGGVYKSTNGGYSWVEKRNGFPPIKRYSFSAPVSAIVVDPLNTNIVYIGIGIPIEGHESGQWSSVNMKGAIYKSIDYGENWSLIRNTGIDTSAMIYSIALEPNFTSILYVSTDFGVYKSTNSGNTWVPKNSGLPHTNARNIIVDPTNSNKLYLTVWSTPGSLPWQGGVYKSTNGGENWLAKNNGLADTVGGPGGLTSNYYTLIIDPQNSQTLYAGNISWWPEPGVFKTIDGGENWTWVTRHVGNINIDPGWIDFWGPSATCIGIDPLDPNKVYFGTSGIICKSENGGEFWEQIYTNLVGSGYWQGRGLETSFVADVTVDPTNSANVYVGYYDIGFLKSTDGGQSFKRFDTGMNYPWNTFSIAIDPNSTNVLYAATGEWKLNEGEVCRSTDYGETWQVIGNTINGLPNAQIWSLAIDLNSPLNSRTLYVACYENGVYKTTNGGGNWFPVNNGLGVNGNYRVKTLVIDPANSSILYSGLQAYDEWQGSWVTVQGGIFVTTNGGQNWNRIDINPFQPSVWDLAIDPTNSNIIYSVTKEHYDHSQQIIYRGGVYKSTNGGTDWIEQSNGFGNIDNLNISSIAINPQNSQYVYVGTYDHNYHDRSSGRGVFKSSDGGNSWLQINNGLGILYTTVITIDPLNPNKLYLGTGGNGVFETNDIVNIDEQENGVLEIPQQIELFQNYPNPFNPLTTIRYGIPKLMDVKIEVFNILGERIDVLINERKNPGYYTSFFDAGNLPSGIYFYRLAADRVVKFRKMLIVK